MDKDYLLKVYGEAWGPEAGPWNTSVTSKYLEYRLARFFEENFTVPPNGQVCNVGIGAGAWDRYLSYRLRGGCLTSVDIDENCCRQLREGLINECNPNRVRVVCSDVMALDGSYDIITMVGSTQREIGLGEALFRKLAGLLNANGSIYYMGPHQQGDFGEMAAFFGDCGLDVIKVQFDDECGYCADYCLLKRSGTMVEGSER